MRRLVILFAIIVALPIISCSSGSKRQASAPELRTPQDMNELLLNVGDAAGSGLILRDEFFTEQNLKRVFSASAVAITRTPSLYSGGLSIHAGIKAFAASIERDTEGLAILGLQITWYKGFRTDGKPKADISVGFKENSGPRFEEVEQLFGTAWLKVDQAPYVYPHSPPKSLPPVTHPRAYARIRYQLGDSSLDRTMELTFDRHGRLSSLSADANASVRYAGSAADMH